MKYFALINRLMDKATGYSEGGGGDTSNAPEQETTETTGETETTGDNNLDEYGYEKPKDDPPKEESPKESKEKDDDESVKDPATGYGEEPPEEPEEEKEPEKEDKTPEEDEKDAFEIKDKGDLLDDEVKELQSFIKKHKLSKEAAEALVENKKAEVKNLKEIAEQHKRERQQQIQETRRKWHEELKNDPTFGGENFAHNIKQSEKVIDQFFPNLKKELTESKTMLPPYVMRDLAKLADHLYGTEKLTQGDAPHSEDETEGNDPLAFYE